ncbi:MAG: hypothetical protein ACE15B_11325 [Bryobacteraceae bacterium]
MQTRREFVAAAALAAGGKTLDPAGTLGSLRRQDGPAPIQGASWYTADADGAGLAFRFPPGALAGVRYLTTDMLLDGDTVAVFAIFLQEGDQGRAFRFAFGALNQCSLRVRMPLELVNQNRWMSDREGAFLKPLAGGDRVDLEKVDRARFVISRKGPGPARWCMTPLAAEGGEVPRLARPLLPKGPLLDQFGQSALRAWPGKTRTESELRARLRGQHERAPRASWPARFSRWGGWKEKKLAAGSGFFRTHHDGRRWWLVDPDGYAFWSAGLDCVRVDVESRYDGIEPALSWMPEPGGPFGQIYGSRGAGRAINYLAANMIRAFGPENWREKWAVIALAEMKRLRFNTVGNWSEWEFAAKAGFPYVRPMSFRPSRAGLVYRDFPDVFHPGFEQDAAEYAAQLKSSANDPAFLGYFLMNEPTWGFSTELPASGMLFNTETCRSRNELARFLKRKYDGNAALAAAWKLPARFERIETGRWTGILTPPALDDLRAFSSVMVERYFSVLSRACRQADPNHLNLGMRWAGVPPAWAVEGMKAFDVFSLNCYQERLPLAVAEKIHAMVGKPVMVGEWHFGALDAGLPASGLGHLRNQEERAKAYRVYLEDAAANSYCVGVHWFTLYDQSAIGRFDGENYNIGFFDVCNRPYDEMGRAATASHERMYQVAAGAERPFEAKLEYLPRLTV